jgi:dTDP-4-dehydrorhamnose reductase
MYITGILIIMLLGAKGLLGTDLCRICVNKGIDVVGYDLPELDLCDNNTDLDRLPDCDWVINCAAYTNVDGAESDYEAALAVNSGIPARVAGFCKKRDISMLHISTDYVFDGTKMVPYSENDETNPVNAYGRSKLAGENAVRDIWNKHIIVRTQSLFGINGKNFIKAICGRIESGQPLRVVNDQVSCPTFTKDLSDAIINLLHVAQYGTVNVSSEEECSWHEFACAIADVVKPGIEIEAVGSSEFPLPAKRPQYSVLSKNRYNEWTGMKMPGWQDALGRYLELQ